MKLLSISIQTSPDNPIELNPAKRCHDIFYEDDDGNVFGKFLCNCERFYINGVIDEEKLKEVLINDN